MRFTETRLRGALAATLCAAALVAAPRAHATPADSTATPPLPVQLVIEPALPCAGDTVAVVADNPCRPCVEIQSFARASDGHLRLEFTQMSPAACSTLPCAPERAAVRLGAFAAGHFTVDVECVWHFPPDSVNTTGGTRIVHRLVSFDVGQCSSGPLPFVKQVTFGEPGPCLTCPPEVCPDRPFPVVLQGALPDSCWKIVSFELLPLLSPVNRPVGRLLVQAPPPNIDCVRTPVPFTVSTPFPPQAPGPHELEIQVAIDYGTDSLQIASQGFPYVARDSCPVPPPLVCAWPYLDPVRPTRVDSIPDTTWRCDLSLAPGSRGPLVFAAHAEGAPLAGLQGEIGASPFLKVVGMQTTGVADGMTLHWLPKGNGASWVLYSGSGAPIPPGPPVPVLRVIVAADSALADPRQGIVYGTVLAASDSGGTAVPVCPIMTLVLPAARVCVSEVPSCDANGDGLSNVADLVRMVQCLVDPADCPDTIAARPDCNGDGEFHVDDVFCCARAILGAPRDGGGLGPGSLRFTFGPATFDGSVMRVALHVQGADELGGALLRLDFPSDRWEPFDEGTGVAASLSAQVATNWTPLVEYGTDDVMVGVLRLDPSAPADLTVPLAFRLRPGASPGGTLTVGSSDLASLDGTPIALDLAGLGATLDAGTPVAPARVALSRARPNPSAGVTRFVVSLPVGGDVDLAVYDLAGRRVATLWQGPLPAGNREFAWEPSRVPSGVYFTRLVVNGEVRSSRVTLRLSR